MLALQWNPPMQSVWPKHNQPILCSFSKLITFILWLLACPNASLQWHWLDKKVWQDWCLSLSLRHCTEFVILYKILTAVWFLQDYTLSCQLAWFFATTPTPSTPHPTPFLNSDLGPFCIQVYSLALLLSNVSISQKVMRKAGCSFFFIGGLLKSWTVNMQIFPFTHIKMENLI